MKLYQAVRAAKDLLQASPSSPLASAASGVRSLPLTEVLCERPHLEKEFEEKWKAPKPQIRDQGSDALLKRQYKFCSKGQIGYIPAKYIISALPEEGESHRLPLNGCIGDVASSPWSSPFVNVSSSCGVIGSLNSSSSRSSTSTISVGPVFRLPPSLLEASPN